MGLMDKLKGAANAITGGGADVSLEMPSGPFRTGEQVKVRVTVRSKGSEVRSGGVFIDIKAVEKGTVRSTQLCNSCNRSLPYTVTVSRTTVEQSITVHPAFVLKKDETKVVDATISIPPGQPTYHGTIDHVWEVRGRLEAFGNDPDSGFRQITVIG
ncbi:MAG: hypothetical protein MUC62_00810 [Candidatus Thermoplasmatota archaeon]|jgi:hypothetical protein|nr:hypothetical protein [Candidatus Thermoplasmatota archaeon]